MIVNKRIVILKKLLVIFMTVIMALPFLWLIAMTFKSNNQIFTAPLALPDSLNFDNYIKAFQTVDFATMFKNSILVCAIDIVLGVILTFPATYAIARFRFRLRGPLYTYFVSGMAIPTFCLMLPIFLITKTLGYGNTPFALAIPYAAGCISFNTLVCVGFFRSFPVEIEEAAIIDGCTLLPLLIRVVAPIAKPVVATTIIFNFLGAWNEFPIASVLLSDKKLHTISVAVSYFQGQYTTDYATMAAAMLIIIIPQLIFYVLLQRYIVDGMVAGAVKG